MCISFLLSIDFEEDLRLGASTGNERFALLSTASDYLLGKMDN